MKAHAWLSPELSTKYVLSNERSEAITAFISIQLLQTHFSLHMWGMQNTSHAKSTALLGHPGSSLGSATTNADDK